MQFSRIKRGCTFKHLMAKRDTYDMLLAYHLESFPLSLLHHGNHNQIYFPNLQEIESKKKLVLDPNVEADLVIGKLLLNQNILYIVLFHFKIYKSNNEKVERGCGQ